MTNYVPVRNLIKLNWIISILISFLTFIFVHAVTRDNITSVLRAIECFIFIALTSFLNLFLLNYLSTKKTAYYFARIRFYMISYFSEIMIALLVRALYSAYTGQRWEGESEFIYESYALGLIAIWVFNTLIIVLQNLVILQHTKAQTEIENLMLKSNVSETAYFLLRQQIHPHFLFNALNTIKSLYKRDLQQGENYLIHLANFLRASISNQKSEVAFIRNELEFCLDYLKMQKIRFGDALDYSISISDETLNNRYIPYFSLQPLVENALKHNDLTEERPIVIKVIERDNYIVVSNNIQLRSYKEHSSGHGLSNLAERYRLLGEDEIIINSDTHFFTVSMKILNR